jgi:hypothetical protein
LVPRTPPQASIRQVELIDDQRSKGVYSINAH